MNPDENQNSMDNVGAALLPISTRGVGMAVAQLYSMLSSCPHLHETLPNIYSIYRGALGMLELKLAHVQNKCNHMLSNADRKLQYVSEFRSNFAVIPVGPKSIGNLINAVGYLKHETGSYVPAVHKRVYENGRYVPRTDNILFSNLRETVVALSDPNTPLEYRKSFFKNNPIPGAQFEDDLLLNPDEIIPEGFGISRAHVRKDMYQTMYLIEKIDLYFGNVQLQVTDFRLNGEESLLISNTQSSLFLPARPRNKTLSEYYTTCNPRGNVTDFCSHGSLEYSSTIEDPSNLLGEVPNMKQFMTSFYKLRDAKRRADAVLLHMGYQEICVAMYPPYEDSSMPVNDEEDSKLACLVKEIQELMPYIDD